MSESQTCGKQNILVVTFTAAWTTVKINTMNGVDVHVNNKKNQRTIGRDRWVQESPGVSNQIVRRTDTYRRDRDS